jgi:integrase
MKIPKPIKHYDKWRIRWVDHLGVRQSKTFATQAEAQLFISEKWPKEQKIKMGLAKPEPTQIDFNTLCELWIKNKAALKKSGDDDISIINFHLRPFFGPLKLSAITPNKVNEFQLTKKISISDKTIHNILTLLISMLNYAVDSNWLHQTPKIKKPKIDPHSSNYSYLKTDKEIQKFLKTTLELKGELLFVLYAGAIYTGMRAGELAALTWDKVDFSSRLIRVSESFDGTTKSNTTRFVPLLDVLHKILLSWQKKGFSSKWVFPNSKGERLQPSGRFFQESIKEVLTAAGFPKTIGRGRRKESHYIVFHDLRHTFASLWMMRSGDIYKLQKILGHTDVKTTQIYAHLNPDAYKDDHSRLNMALDFL